MAQHVPTMSHVQVPEDLCPMDHMKSDQALEQAAQGGGWVPIPGVV